jgi:hypothetical protein
MIDHPRHILSVLAALATATVAVSVPPVPVPPPSVGPDLVMSGLGSGNVGNDAGDVNGFGTTLWGSAAGVFGYSMNTAACNIGSSPLSWFEFTNQHPVFGTQVYRYRIVDGAGRFEQVGMSWLKHGTCGADAARCTDLVTPLQIPQTQGDCDGLGPFRTDLYGASMNGDQPMLGPRSEVNPWTGVFPFPYQLQQGQSGNQPFKRMQVNAADMAVGDTYIMEVVGIAPNEPPANRSNNYAYRMATLGGPNGTTFTLTGPTFSMQPAINAWRAIDAGVTITAASPLGGADGQVFLASRVTPVAADRWHYEYALFNMNLNAAVERFAVPAAPRLAVTNEGFRAPAYHSGEPYDNTPWSTARTPTTIEWNTPAFPTSPLNAGAIRWSTTANFRFDANAPPVAGTISLNTFTAAGTLPGTAFTISAPVPSTPPCRADLTGDGATNTADLTFFLGRFGQPASPPGSGADFNADGTVNTPDLTFFLGDFGCPN